MTAQSLPDQLIAGFVLLLALAPLGLLLWLRLRQLWLAGELLQRGLEGNGQVVGRRQDFGVTTYRLQFTTPAGQTVEDYSSGWRVLPDPGYPDGAWVSLRYVEAQPARYMLASELSLANLLASAGLLLLVPLLVLGWLANY